MFKKMSRKVSPVSFTSSISASIGTSTNSLVRLLSGESAEVMEEKYALLNFFNLAENMRTGIQTKTHVHHFKTYKNVFLASEAVAWLLQEGIAGNVAEAVFLGAELCSMGFVYKVIGDEESEFRDNHDLLRFASDDYSEKSRYMPEQLEEMKNAFKEGMKELNTKRGAPYKNPSVLVFYGAEAVTWIIEAGWARRRADAFRIGEMLAEERLILPFGGEHPFMDDLALFQLVSDPFVQALHANRDLATGDARRRSSAALAAMPSKPRGLPRRNSKLNLSLPRFDSATRVALEVPPGDL
ncbi:DEP domain-containing mTOR-interacting protein [Porphyridium purpureum]|uniref:DEP domain-containing mTOR-interacting protein n=1 Tax=Porphyridium purpureum TaxID=35688 RepID=A0A5J4Z915_PORPP|nr:DEP domain-containing mTOR-interacting protein [Porphyridium purpureum]|eukprot:POR4899..scf295_1